MSHTERSLFLSAIDIPSGTPRREYLEAACQADSGLRDRVEGLLQEHQEGGGPLDRPPADLELSALHPVLIPAERIGDCLGFYRLLQQIGEGALGR
jgi:hypothetical protein